MPHWLRALLLVLLSAPLALAQSPDGTAIDSVEAAPQVVVPFTRWVRSDTATVGLHAIPGRTVREAAALLPGISADFGDGTLSARSRAGALSLDLGRFPFRDRVGQEPVYEIDGVRVIGEPFVPYESIAAMEALTSFVPASVGDVGAGVIRVTTQDGSETVRARLEGLSSAATDPYGYTRVGGAVTGPIGDASFGQFSVAGSWLDQADANPYGIPFYQLNDEAYAALQQNPQVIAVRGQDGGVEYLPFPVEAARAAADRGDVFGPGQLAGFFPAGTEILDFTPIAAPFTYAPEAFEEVWSKAAPRSALTLHGRTVLEPSAGLRVAIGGDLLRDRRDGVASYVEQFSRLLYNQDGLYAVDQDGWRIFGSVRQELAGAAFHLKGHIQEEHSVQYPSVFSTDVRDALDYGDIEQTTTARRYFVLSQDGYVPRFTQDGSLIPGTSYGTFVLPGTVGTVFQQSSDAAYGFGADGTVQLGVHHLQFGGEFEQRTHRYYRLDGAPLARYAADGSPETGPGVASYEDLPIEAFRDQTFYYGYDAYGLEAVSDENIDAFLAGGNRDIAPYRPIYYAGFLRDRLQWQALTLDLGLRVEAFDANANVLLDPYAAVPIVRVRDLDSAPASIGLDYAVYFNDGGEIVGYRDLEGAFYDPSGAEATASAITGAASGQVMRDEDADPSTAFIRTGLDTFWQPRLGASLTLSPTLQGFAYYTRQTRRPSAALYASPLVVVEGLGQDGRVGSAGLSPEVVESSGLGLEAALMPGLNTAVSAFLRRYEDRITPVAIDPGFPFYVTYQNAGTLTSYGLDLAMEYERQPFGIRAHYTLAFATANDAQDATGLLVLLALQDAPSDLDARHTLDVVAALRLPDEQGIFGGLRAAVAVLARSGLPYSALAAPGSGGSTSLNATRLPGAAQVDLRVDKGFALGPGRLTVFLWVENVLGTRNVLGVYRGTGQADTDGFLSTPAGDAFLNGAIDAESARFQYGAFTSGPVNVGGGQSSGGSLFYGQPRQIRLGLRLGV